MQTGELRPNLVITLQIDETRVDDPEEMKRNLKRLLDNAGVFWITIQKSVDQCPRYEFFCKDSILAMS